MIKTLQKNQEIPRCKNSHNLLYIFYNYWVFPDNIMQNELF